MYMIMCVYSVVYSSYIRVLYTYMYIERLCVCYLILRSNLKTFSIKFMASTYIHCTCSQFPIGDWPPGAYGQADYSTANLQVYAM